MRLTDRVPDKRGMPCQFEKSVATAIRTTGQLPAVEHFSAQDPKGLSLTEYCGGVFASEIFSKDRNSVGSFIASRTRIADRSGIGISERSERSLDRPMQIDKRFLGTFDVIPNREIESKFGHPETPRKIRAYP
jgi:hypothetical protein